MAQSAELTEFYRAYLEWVNAGAPEEITETQNIHGFYRGIALCGNLQSFCFYYKCYGYHAIFVEELIAQFEKAGLCTNYPFNTRESFTEEVTWDTCHLNQKRIKWVREHCQP